MNYYMDSFTITDTLQINDRKEFLAYLRANKMTKEKFIIETFHKTDLYTHEPLLYKNEDQYLINDFNNRENLIDYLFASVNPKEYLLSFFKRRAERKGLVYAPSDVELKSYIAPSIRAIEKCEIDYKELMIEIGLKVRFDYSVKKLNQKNDEELIIIQDTREQKELKFKVKSEISKLDFGDYSCLGNYFSSVYIERKSLSDFIGSIGKDFERFKKEVARAGNLNSFLIVVIESDLRKSLKFNELSYIHAKASPEYVFHNMREIMEKNAHVQFLFVRDRHESSRVIEKIFRVGEKIKNCDLQFLYEQGSL